MCMAFKDIYIKIDEIHNGQGYLKKPILKPVSAVVTANLQEDLEKGSTKGHLRYFYLITQILRP